MSSTDYEKLGLSEGASLDEVKKKYDLLMRRSIRDESLDIDSITEAYDRIVEANTTEFFDTEAELLEEEGLNWKKVKNFIYQRKILIGVLVWVLIGIILLLFMILKPESGNYTPDIAPFF